MIGRSNQRDIRSGFTLLELMIVLVILVIVMSVAWPRITGQMQKVGPQEAAIQLKSDLSEARQQAVLTGEAWCIRVERGTGNYELGPVSRFRDRQDMNQANTLAGVGVGSPEGSVESLLSQTDTVQTAVDTQTAPTTIDQTANSSIAIGPTNSPQSKRRIERLELPVGMVFDDGFAHSTQDVNQVRLNDPNQPSPAPVVAAVPPAVPVAPIPIDNWKYVVIFQPDGRATESEIRLKEVTSEAKIRLRIRGFTGGVTIDAVERKARIATPVDPENPLDTLIETSDPNQQPAADPLDGNTIDANTLQQGVYKLDAPASESANSAANTRWRVQLVSMTLPANRWLEDCL